jgi:hypothetical protein
MAADELDFRIYDALACQICQNLVSEKGWVDTLFDLGFIIHFQSEEVCRAEIHWYEAHGKGKKDLKIKRFWIR